jgi:internalin-related protein
LLCANNKLVALDASNNTKLEQLYCFGNSLPQLDLKTNTYLSSLYCNENSLTSLDMSKNARLTFVNCRKNKLTLLDVTHNAELMGLIGDNNSISSLDVSKSLHLTSLFCSENSLASLDISKNTQLKYLVCYGNNLSTVVLDDIYCALPDRKGKFSGVIRPSLNASSSENTKVIATNGSNATSKNWKVQYYESDTDITGFTGTHQCGGGTDIDNTKNNPSLIIYPNPVKDILHISSDKPMHSIRIYNMYGTEVLQTVATNCINVSHLPSGIYMVRADNKIVRIIKE